MYEQNPYYFKVQQEVYEETAVEDEEACLLLDGGRKSLWLDDKNEFGPVESFLEKGVELFYEYYKKTTTT
jgi:hypothetical protein